MYQAKKYFGTGRKNGMTFAGWQVVDESGTAVPVIYEDKREADEAALSINCELGLESAPNDIRSESEILKRIIFITKADESDVSFDYKAGYRAGLLWVLKMD